MRIVLDMNMTPFIADALAGKSLVERIDISVVSGVVGKPDPPILAVSLDERNIVAALIKVGIDEADPASVSVGDHEGVGCVANGELCPGLVLDDDLAGDINWLEEGHDVDVVERTSPVDEAGMLRIALLPA
jgi:hypothetical protein